MQVSLHNDDCLNALKNIKDCSVSLILVDPPYIVSRKTGFKNFGKNTNSELKRKYNISYEFGDWDNQQVLDLKQLFSEYHRILKKSGTLITFYDKWKIQELKEVSELAGFTQHRLCIWCKTNPVPINSKTNYLTNAQEFFMTCVKGSKPTFNSEYDNGVYSFPICHGSERTTHPTQKPLALMCELIKKHSNEGDMVVDCFMGSGSTGVACVSTERNFIGVELDENYFKIAKQRINNELKSSQNKLF